MDERVKKLWLDELRYGGLKQGKQALYNLEADSYCCLGVLCRIAVDEDVVDEWCDDNDTPDCPSVVAFGTAEWSSDVSTRDADGASSYLPIEVLMWAGLDSRDPTVSGRALSNWNDLEGASFKKIADLIEKEL